MTDKSAVDALRAVLDRLPKATCYRNHTQLDEHLGVFGAAWIADVVRALAASATDEGPDPVGTKRVLMTDELFDQLGAGRVEWGEPDKRGFYTPTVYTRPAAPVALDDSAFTRTLRAYAGRAHDNVSYRALVPEVVLRDAAAVIDDYRARPAAPVALDDPLLDEPCCSQENPHRATPTITDRARIARHWFDEAQAFRSGATDQRTETGTVLSPRGFVSADEDRRPGIAARPAAPAALDVERLGDALARVFPVSFRGEPATEPLKSRALLMDYAHRIAREYTALRSEEPTDDR